MAASHALSYLKKFFKNFVELFDIFFLNRIICQCKQFSSHRRQAVLQKQAWKDLDVLTSHSLPAGNRGTQCRLLTRCSETRREIDRHIQSAVSQKNIDRRDNHGESNSTLYVRNLWIRVQKDHDQDELPTSGCVDQMGGREYHGMSVLLREAEAPRGEGLRPDRESEDRKPIRMLR